MTADGYATVPEFGPIKLVKHQKIVTRLRGALEAANDEFERDEIMWLVGMLLDGIRQGEFDADEGATS